jgi:hypothetical protein
MVIVPTFARIFLIDKISKDDRRNCKKNLIYNEMSLRSLKSPVAKAPDILGWKQTNAARNQT